MRSAAWSGLGLRPSVKTFVYYAKGQLLAGNPPD